MFVFRCLYKRDIENKFTVTKGEVGTGKPGVMQFMELQRVRHDLATEQWTTLL